MADTTAPDPARKAQFQRFFRHTTISPGFTLPDSTQLLKNSIHPILSRPKFSNVTDRQYDAMKPTLRFVTKALEHDEVCRYVETMINGIFYHADGASRGAVLDLEGLLRPRDGESSSEYTRVLAFPNPDLTGVESVRSRAAKIWQKLAPMVDFTVHQQKDRTCGGVTRRRGEKTWLSLAGVRFPPACASRISIHKTLVEAVEREYVHVDSSDMQKRFNFHTFAGELGRVLVHELSHALHSAIWGPRLEEAYYKNCIFSEAGHQLEALLYGGNIITMEHEEYKFGVLRLWPSPSIARIYKEAGAKIGLRETLGHIDVCRSLPPGQRAAILTEAFWTNEAKGRPLYSCSTPTWDFDFEDIASPVPVYAPFEELNSFTQELVRALKGEGVIDMEESWGELFEMDDSESEDTGTEDAEERPEN